MVLRRNNLEKMPLVNTRPEDVRHILYTTIANIGKDIPQLLVIEPLIVHHGSDIKTI